MPANIAHILIANTAYDKIKASNPALGERILYKTPFFYLGSLGPDLPSYTTSNLVREALSKLFLRPFTDMTNPVQEDLSYFLHSTHPHMFPFYLTEVNVNYMKLRSGELVADDFNQATHAFTLGYACHMAADQVVHGLVRELVGPYYRDKATTERHAECEVYQDAFLFQEMFPNRQFSKTFQKQMISIERFGFDYDGFCNLLSLAVSKAGYRRISKQDIDGWIDGILLAFDLMDSVGPYVSAFKDLEANKKHLKEFPFYKKYYRSASLDYIKWFDKAVEICVTYMEEIDDLWEGQDFSYERRAKYEQKISAEDLTSPWNIRP